MTYEEAIDTIEIARAEVEWDYPLEYSVAFDIAIDALKRHIPKKPIARTDLYPTGQYECPICGCGIVGKGENAKKSNFCLFCGTRFDWR